MTIKSRVSMMLALVAFVSVATGVYLFSALSGAKDDAAIIEALGRQRMLSQAMAKSVLGYASAKQNYESLKARVTSLDGYITSMRGQYTTSVVPRAKEAGIDLSMTPESEPHPAVPFPATFTRLVNKKAGGESNNGMSVAIMSDYPINPDSKLQTKLDAEATEFLTKNTKGIFIKPEEINKGMTLTFYTADTAIAQGCADCHTTMEGRDYKKGDILGIRRFRIPFAPTMASGDKLLNPSLKEYETAKLIFTETLAAMKSGGEYPLDLGRKNFRTVNGIKDETSQKLIVDIEATFSELEKTTKSILAGSAKKDAPLVLGTQANNLRGVSNKLVAHYANLADEKQSTIRWAIVVSSVVIMCTIAFVFMFMSKVVIGRIGRLSDAMVSLAKGDKTTEINYASDSDEIGGMARSVQVFKDNMIETERLNLEKQKEQAESARRAEIRERLSEQFEADVTGMLKEVSSASEIMKGSAESMSATAKQTSSQSTAVASASEEASTNVQTVASAAEELSSSIDEISRQVAQSSAVAAKAVKDAKETDQKIQGLAEAAQRIGEVVELITDIADQTNLLALNATIEAARAGEAGKGFAVVASEVKNLANQTAKATEEIGQQIGGIQQATQDSVSAIQHIGATITEIDEIASAIAAAMEEQGAATQEIARNVEQAAAGTGEVTSTIAGVNQAADETGRAAADVLHAVEGLTQQANALTRQVEGFLKGLKEA